MVHSSPDKVESVYALHLGSHPNREILTAYGLHLLLQD